MAGSGHWLTRTLVNVRWWSNQCEEDEKLFFPRSLNENRDGNQVFVWVCVFIIFTLASGFSRLVFASTNVDSMWYCEISTQRTVMIRSHVVFFLCDDALWRVQTRSELRDFPLQQIFFYAFMLSFWSLACGWMKQKQKLNVIRSHHIISTIMGIVCDINNDDRVSLHTRRAVDELN